MKVKGFIVEIVEMGRMIDFYFLEDKDEKGKWWCFYKQNGVSILYSYDLQIWNFFGYIKLGENVCVLNEKDGYILFYLLYNGIVIKCLLDLSKWMDWGDLIILGQQEWSWVKGRIMVGVVVNLKEKKELGKYFMFFYGLGFKFEKEGDFDKNVLIGIVWSDDFVYWDWLGKK